MATKAITFSFPSNDITVLSHDQDGGYRDYENIVVQGAYDGSNQYCGVVRFKDLSSLKNKIITSITFNFTFGGTGLSNDKTLWIYQSNIQRQAPSTSHTPNLEKLLYKSPSDSKRYSDQEYTIDKNNEYENFLSLSNFFTGGNDTIVFYDPEGGETTWEGITYGKNYLSITEMTVTIEYEESNLYIFDGENFVLGTPYVFNNGAFQQGTLCYVKKEDGSFG